MYTRFNDSTDKNMPSRVEGKAHRRDRSMKPDLDFDLGIGRTAWGTLPGYPLEATGWGRSLQALDPLLPSSRIMRLALS